MRCRRLLLSLDGLCPEGGEAQLWVVRELQSGLTLRSGWLSQQDTPSFERFLAPIAALDLTVTAVMSDKQRALPAAVQSVFPDAKHAFCQMHYLKNLAEPIAEDDEHMKVALRKAVRHEVGHLIRPEKVEATGVLTVTGLIPTPVEAATKEATSTEDSPPSGSECLEQEAVVREQEAVVQEQEAVVREQEAVVQDLQRRVRYLLTLKGRPPFRLAGLEMAERLSEVETCLDALLDHRSDARLVTLKHGLQTALKSVKTDYLLIRQVADWLGKIAHILEPEGKTQRSGDQISQELFDALEAMDSESQDSHRLRQCYTKMLRTSLSYAPGLFYCYDVEGLPRTNNDRESEFRELNRRLLRTTGQKGLVKRILHREGAWELIPRPDSLQETIHVLAQVEPEEFDKERQRLRNHRNRFRMHTRSQNRARGLLQKIQQRWKAMPPDDSS